MIKITILFAVRCSKCGATCTSYRHEIASMCGSCQEKEKNRPPRPQNPKLSRSSRFFARGMEELRQNTTITNKCDLCAGVCCIGLECLSEKRKNGQTTCQPPKGTIFTFVEVHRKIKYL